MLVIGGGLVMTIMVIVGLIIGIPITIGGIRAWIVWRDSRAIQAATLCKAEAEAAEAEMRAINEQMRTWSSGTSNRLVHRRDGSEAEID